MLVQCSYKRFVLFIGILMEAILLVVCMEIMRLSITSLDNWEPPISPVM